MGVNATMYWQLATTIVNQTFEGPHQCYKWCQELAHKDGNHTKHLECWFRTERIHILINGMKYINFDGFMGFFLLLLRKTWWECKIVGYKI